MTEQSVHEQLKQWYAEPGDQLEAELEGYVIDVIKDGLLIEIQTGSFSSIKPKLKDLLNNHYMRLVHPIPFMKWIIRLDQDGNRVGRRKSPKLGREEEVFNELVYMPSLLSRINFELEVALINVDEYWIDDGKGSWRRKRWSIHDRKLLNVYKTRLFKSPLDMLPLLPPELSREFTSRELWKGSGLTKALSQKMIYCFKKMGLLEVSGKRGRANLYSIAI